MRRNGKAAVALGEPRQTAIPVVKPATQTMKEQRRAQPPTSRALFRMPPIGVGLRCRAHAPVGVARVAHLRPRAARGLVLGRNEVGEGEQEDAEGGGDETCRRHAGLVQPRAVVPGEDRQRARYRIRKGQQNSHFGGGEAVLLLQRRDNGGQDARLRHRRPQRVHEDVHEEPGHISEYIH